MGPCVVRWQADRRRGQSDCALCSRKVLTGFAPVRPRHRLNCGVVYVQNARPDGPTAYMLAEIVDRTERWARGWRDVGVRGWTRRRGGGYAGSARYQCNASVSHKEPWGHKVETLLTQDGEVGDGGMAGGAGRGVCGVCSAEEGSKERRCGGVEVWGCGAERTGMRRGVFCSKATGTGMVQCWGAERRDPHFGLTALGRVSCLTYSTKHCKVCLTRSLGPSCCLFPGRQVGRGSRVRVVPWPPPNLRGQGGGGGGVGRGGGARSERKRVTLPSYEQQARTCMIASQLLASLHGARVDMFWVVAGWCVEGMGVWGCDIAVVLRGWPYKRCSQGVGRMFNGLLHGCRVQGTHGRKRCEASWAEREYRALRLSARVQPKLGMLRPLEPQASQVALYAPTCHASQLRTRHPTSRILHPTTTPMPTPTPLTHSDTLLSAVSGRPMAPLCWIKGEGEPVRQWEAAHLAALGVAQPSPEGFLVPQAYMTVGGVARVILLVALCGFPTEMLLLTADAHLRMPEKRASQRHNLLSRTSRVRM